METDRTDWRLVLLIWAAGLGAAGRLFLPSPPAAVQAFHARLIDLGVICTVRVPRGNEEDSACGMLRVTKGGSGVD